MDRNDDSKKARLMVSWWTDIINIHLYRSWRFPYSFPPESGYQKSCMKGEQEKWRYYRKHNSEKWSRLDRDSTLYLNAGKQWLINDSCPDSAVPTFSTFLLLIQQHPRWWWKWHNVWRTEFWDIQMIKKANRKQNTRFWQDVVTRRKYHQWQLSTSSCGRTIYQDCYGGSI